MFVRIKVHSSINEQGTIFHGLWYKGLLGDTSQGGSIVADKKLEVVKCGKRPAITHGQLFLDWPPEVHSAVPSFTKNRSFHR
ncbi:hypothetical protein J6590_022314 [Homalodisca vitripennis]|nr:hypothetical protein J6590_022314 [Homalodisca vitripennis]